MQIVEALDHSDVCDSQGTLAFRLEAGCRYLLHDLEAGLGLRQKAVQIVERSDSVPQPYRGEPLSNERLILPFIGKCGDAITVSCCLSGLAQANPAMSIDICVPPSVRDVFLLFTRPGDLLPYPLALDQLAKYDYLLSLEDVDAIRNGTSKSCGDVFRACLRTPRPRQAPMVQISPESRTRHRLPDTDRLRMAVHCARPGSLRSYPVDLIEELTELLATKGFDVFLFGSSDAPRAFDFREAEHIVNLCGQTTTPSDLAALLEQVDGIVACDSFPMHLGGVLGVPTLALFSSTDAVLGSEYASARTLQSRAICSPCGVAEGVCPQRHADCIAHRDPSLSPESILNHVQDLLRSTTLRASLTVR